MRRRLFSLTTDLGALRLQTLHLQPVRLEEIGLTLLRGETLGLETRSLLGDPLLLLLQPPLLFGERVILLGQGRGPGVDDLGGWCVGSTTSSSGVSLTIGIAPAGSR